MTPLGAVVLGTVLVMLDLRIETFDLVPDPLGWGLLVWACVRLRGAHPAFGWAVAATVVGLLVSLPGQVGELPTPLGLLGVAAETAVVFAVCTGIHARSVNPARARQAGTIRWWNLALAALAVLLGAVLSEQDTDLAPLVLLAVVVALGVHVWYLVVAWAVRDEPALGGAGALPATGPGSSGSPATS